VDIDNIHAMYCRRRIRILPLILAGLIFISGLILACSGESADRPNLVLIIIDTLRADHLGCYGHDEIETPYIDALAENGVRFENAASHIPFTLPAITSIMSSTLPPTSGVHYNEGFFVDTKTRTLAEIVSENGYATGAVVASIVLRSVTGISQGFGQYHDRFPPEYIGYQETVKLIESQLGGVQRRADEGTDKALAVAEEMAADSPFFLFVHYFDPHYPMDPPPPFAPRIDPSGIDDPRKRLVRLYDGEIEFTDSQVGRLIEGLHDLDLLDKTLIVLTSDHGEGLQEHRESQHGFFVYDQTIHIPLIFSWPAKLPRRKVCSTLGRHIDIAPTILDILGVGWRDQTDFQGTSLYPFDNDSNPDYSYFEAAMPYLLHGWSGLRGIRSVDWKFISAPGEELYHLASDPGEENNLIDSIPEVATSMREELDRMVEGFEIYQSGVTGQELSLGEKSLVDPFMETGLRALGYLGTVKHYSATYEEIFNRSLPDPKEKIDEYNRIQSADLPMTLGMALIEKDSLDAAIQQLKRAVSDDPSNVHAYFYLGLAHREAGHYPEAVEMLERSLEIEPSYIKANLALADIHLIRGDSTRARAELDGAVSVGIYTRKELLLAIQLWERLGERERAVRTLEEALEVMPDDAAVHIHLAEYSLLEGNYDTALSHLEPLDLSRETDGDLLTRAYYALGRCYYHRGDSNRAAEMFQNVISIDPTIADGHNQLGLVYDDMGEYGKAVSSYREALRLNEKRVEVHSNLGVTYYKMGRYREAREEFEIYLEHVEDEAEAERLNALIEQIREGE